MTSRASVDFAISEEGPIHVQPATAGDVEQNHDRPDSGGEGLSQEASDEAREQQRPSSVQHHLAGLVNRSEIPRLQFEPIQSKKPEDGANPTMAALDAGDIAIEMVHQIDEEKEESQEEIS